tara:strand:- start:420 stop:1067 length:648 start_codon:yes stop_codon:yes gene_type:complete
MKEQKRMKYYNLSSNIIACDNYLPQQVVENIYTDLLNNRETFNVPNWSFPNSPIEKKEFFSSRCGGFDFWIAWDEIAQKKLFIESLSHWFFHDGFFSYASLNDNNKSFKLMKRKIEWDIHVICYNNGGYYNWHEDLGVKNLFTFNLILNKGNKLKGGDMFFMDDNKIIKVKNKNNFMVVFPSFIPHCISPLYTENNEDVSFLEQRFSLQFWVRLA